MHKRNGFGLCMLNCDVEMMSNQDGLMMVLCRARGKISPFLLTDVNRIQRVNILLHMTFS